MSTVFFILFTLAEITLVVLTFTGFSEKAAWLKNRTLIRTIETFLLFVMVLVPATHMKWRYAVALTVLFIRLLISCIAWIVNRKKAQGRRGKAVTVVSCIFSIIFMMILLTPAFIFTNYNGLPTTGEYEINQVEAILVDENRTDPFENDGSFREVPAHFFYPKNTNDSFPLVIFSHGAFGYYQSNYSTYSELASHGYIVVALDHPHHSFFTTDTSGAAVIVDTNFINDVMRINDIESEEEAFMLSHEWLKLRTDDENFVLDTIIDAAKSRSLNSAWNTDDADTINKVVAEIDIDKIGLFGHSLGGATSVSLGRERKDVDAVIVLDGTMLGERTEAKNGKYVYYNEPYPVPILDFTKANDYNEREQYKSENGYPYVNEYVIDNANDGRTVISSNAEHMDFTDLPLISPFLASILGSGDIDHEEMMNKVNGIVLNWFDYYLKNEGTLDIQANY